MTRSIPRILVIDNYDSFTYNLVHLLKKLGAEVSTLRNDKLTLDTPRDYDAMVLSPGPGLPEDAGLLKALIEAHQESLPILGVCLGHQAIAEVFGGELKNLDRVYHGVAGQISVTAEEPLFRRLPSNFEAARYHSWVVAEPLPDCLQVSARSAEGHVMALRHQNLPIVGLQFHPESVLTPLGNIIISNWLDTAVTIRTRSLQTENHTEA